MRARESPYHFTLQRKPPFLHPLEEFPPARAGERVDGVAHTVWTLVWHMNEVIRDIIDYVDDPEGYTAKEYPTGYWPES